MFEVSLFVLSGTLSLANTSGLTFSHGDGTDDAEIRCLGSSAAINAALDSIRYMPLPDYNSVRWALSHLGHMTSYQWDKILIEFQHFA